MITSDNPRTEDPAAIINEVLAGVPAAARAKIHVESDRQAAIRSLQTARQVAPQQTRYNPMVRETVASIALAEKRSTEPLRALATWIGLDR